MIKYSYGGKAFQKATGEVPVEIQIEMFRSMLRIRRIEEEIERRYKEDEMKTPIHLVIGQEGSTVGACMAMRPQDIAFSGHRTHGVYLAKGGDYKAMMSELYCKENGCSGSRGGSMHLYDKKAGMEGSSAICGGAVPIATGAALTAQMTRQDKVTVVFFGDGAAEEGVVWESLNFAALKKLPVIYVCENNFYSVCSPLDKRQPPGVDLYKKAASFGVEGVLADGTNVNEVYEAMKDAVAHASSGKGPVFLETRAYRWRAHGGFGDDSIIGYRTIEEVTHWQALDPVEIQYQNLLQSKSIDGNDREKMEGEIKKEIEEAFAHAKASPVPEEKDLYTHVYAPSY